jgi:Flp pilus assembly protein TadD
MAAAGRASFYDGDTLLCYRHGSLQIACRMNRKTRRAGLKSASAATIGAFAEEARGTLSAPELLAYADQLHLQGQTEQAEIVCNKILAREPAHAEALNLLGASFKKPAGIGSP